RGGGHHVGGGVALWQVGGNTNNFAPGLFGVNFEPPEIRSLARWHVKRSAIDVSKDYTMDDLVYPTEPGAFTVEFTPSNGWGTPTNELGIAYANQVNRITVRYVPLTLKYVVVTNLNRQITDVQFFVQGTPGRRYKIHAVGVLTNSLSWTNIPAIILNQPTARIIDPVQRAPFRFYRAKEDPFYP
ncbi:MAG TPA: hypothetical protein VJ063_17510, partial [Verrucomicrobiae bacterium]|nr:hypothetical protein [Verrucomicrobiae bacterium]